MSARLLNVQTACRRLGITRSQLQNLYPLIPHVHIQSVGTHLFPEEYINTLVTHLDGPATMLGVRRFNNQQRLVSELVEQARADLATQISVRDYHTAEQVAEILGVGIMTAHNWRQSGSLPFRAHVVRTERHSRQGRRVHLISTPDLRRVLEWQIPDQL